LVSGIRIHQAATVFLAGIQKLVPHWPQLRTGEITVLFTLTLVVAAVAQGSWRHPGSAGPALRHGFGGRARPRASLCLEQLFSMLLAPSMMLVSFHLRGADPHGQSPAWNAQARDDRGIGWREAFKRQKWQLANSSCLGGGAMRMPRSFSGG